MNIVTDIEEWQKIRKQLQQKTIGFVHTMGHLHAGHMSLCDRAKKENDVCVAAIFVNPMQFNQKTDFERYPRTLEHDKNLLLQHQVDYLLLFDTEQLYTDHYQVKVSETELSKSLEGEFRPGHFEGMLTIVLKFLNLVMPSISYYGEKDYQQLLLIKKMVNALFLPIIIVGCETVRAHDQVAESSRNNRLNIEQRQKAAHFPRLLQSALTPEQIKMELHQLGFKVDYVVDQWQRRLGAVWLDDVRLIDNITLS